MHYSTPADAETWAAIRIALAALGAYADGALIWHVGERHTDDDAGGWGLGVGGWEEPRLLRDERLGYLLSLPQQAD